MVSRNVKRAAGWSAGGRLGDKAAVSFGSRLGVSSAGSIFVDRTLSPVPRWYALRNSLVHTRTQ
jgi:hypothetical protein